ncbi:MAG TPA: 3-hydroxyalkanoate synthetase, partial [Achromobacter sp.]|nr:3-hydroxyalkanoate synthetase [Achromobacter sp.]
PLRLPYELISDRNPAIAPIAKIAEQVREQRQVAPASNPFLMAQEMFSNWVETSLNIWQELRDSADERTFMGVYGSPLVQDLAGLGAKSGPPRKHPGVSPEHRRFMEDRAAELRSMVQEGGLRVAAIRMLLYVSGAEGGLDERSFALIRKMRAESDNALTLQEFKDLTRDQALILTLDSDAALLAMPHLLENSPAPAIRDALETMKRVLEAAEPLSPAARESLDEMERIFLAAERRAQKRNSAQAPARLPTPAPAAAAPALQLVEAAAHVPVKKARPHPAAAESAVAKAAMDTPAKAAAKPASKTTAKRAAKPAAKSAAKSAAAPAKRASKAAARQPAKVKSA